VEGRKCLNVFLHLLKRRELLVLAIYGGAKMRKRVLVVDDVPDWRASLQEILKGEFEVITVDSYQAAMEVVRRRGAELVIVDLRLSPTDEEDRQGMELLKALAEYRINAIVLTGYPEKELQEEAEAKYKIFDFIDKSALAYGKELIRTVVREAFELLESKERKKATAIQIARTGQPVPFSEELSGWPLKDSRKDKED
jgi:DNA-binding NtrC family response regulator